MPTVHTAHGPGEIVQTDTVRGRTQYKVAGAGFEVWLDETKVGSVHEAIGYPDELIPQGPAHRHQDMWSPEEIQQLKGRVPDSHPDDPVTPFSHLGDEDPYYPDEFDGGRAGEIFNNAPHSFGRGVEDASADAHALGGERYRTEIGTPYGDYMDRTRLQGSYHQAWAPVDHDNSVNLPYNPDPQYPAIPGDVESTIQPIHEIDPDERLRPADSITFENRDDEEAGDGVGMFADNFAKAGAHDQYHQLEQGAPERQEYRHPSFNTDDFADELGSALSPPVYDNPGYNKHAPGYDPHRDYTRWEDAWPRESSVHEANPLLLALPELLGGAEAAGAAEGGAAAEAAGGAEKAFTGNPGQTTEGRDNSDGVHKLGPGPGWGDLIPTASVHQADWHNFVQDISTHPSEHERQDQHYRPAGLSDKYIDITADADYHNDPVAQFRHDPVAFINRTGHVHDEGFGTRMGEYMDLIDADVHLREAAWKDVRKKAMRLKAAGAVHVKDVGPDRIYASVDGDNGVYDVMIKKGGAFGGFGGGHAITNWHCSCEWGKWAFKRQMTYVGRLCSHGYASYLTMQSAHVKGQPRLPRQTRPYKQADALQNEPQRLVPELVINDHDDHEMFQQDVDVTKDERKDTGPDDIVHFSKVMAYCDQNQVAYPRELVAFLDHYADAAPAAPTADTSNATDPAGGQTPAATVSPAGQPNAVAPASGINTGMGAPGTQGGAANPASGSGGMTQGRGGFDMGQLSGITDMVGQGISTGTGIASDVMGLIGGGLGGLLGSTFHSRYTDGNGRWFEADDQTTQDWKIDDASDAASSLKKIRDYAEDPLEKDLGHMEERNDAVRDAVERAREDGVDADQLVASRHFRADDLGNGIDYTPGTRPDSNERRAPTGGDDLGNGMSYTPGVSSHPTDIGNGMTFSPGGGTARPTPPPPPSHDSVPTAPPGQAPPIAPGTPANQVPSAPPGSPAGGQGKAYTPPSSVGYGGGAGLPAGVKADTPGTPGSSIPASPGTAWQQNTDKSQIGGGDYKVTQGDTLADIAQRSGYGGDYNSLAQQNKIGDPNKIDVGQTIKIAPPGQSDTGGSGATPGAGGLQRSETKPSGQTPPAGGLSGPGANAAPAVSAAPAASPVSTPAAPAATSEHGTHRPAALNSNMFDDEWYRYAYPNGDADHQPFNGSGPADPLDIGTSEAYVKKERNKHEDIMSDSMEHYRNEGIGQTASLDGGIRRVGNGPRRPAVVPEVVREQRPQKGHEAAHIPVNDYDPLAERTAASFDDPYSEDLAAIRTASAGGDLVAAFQNSTGGQAVMAANSDGGQSNDDIASAAMGFLRTAGRNFSLAEQAELIHEGDRGGAGNLGDLDLRDTHYEAMNSVGLW